MSYKKIFIGTLAVSFSAILFASTVFAKNGELKSLSDNQTQNNQIQRVKSVNCGFSAPEEKIYDTELIAIRRRLRVEPDETFRVKIFMKNTGNMPWFSNNNNCLGPKMSLGTMRERDRDSVFYEYGLLGWEGNNRIGMDQLRVNPGEIASFTFSAKAGSKSDVYKEYFAPVLKDIQWIDKDEFYFTIMVGETGDSAIALRKKMDYANFSGSVNSIDLDAKRTVMIDLSEQRMKIKLGDNIVRDFRVSTGASKTPTPVGETKILIKQEVRVGHKPPHYIMPKYQMFRAGGFGFHALPSLGNDGGVFWTEARNHIGIPVSHGCIRLLPEDANWLYDFTAVGDNVIVQR